MRHFLPVRVSEADPYVKALYAGRARSTNSEQRHADDAQAQVSTPSIQSSGLQGLGDARYPISAELLGKLQSQPKFVKRCSAAWRSFTGHMCPSAKVPRTSGSKSRCTADFCWTSSLERLDKSRVDLCTGLLHNVLRSLRPNSIRKASHHITASSRHPMLLVESAGVVRGWLITRPSFKPLSLHGWKLGLPERIMPNQPFVASLDFQHIGPRRLPALQSMEQIVAAVSEGASPVRYRMPAYKVYWDSLLSHLHVEDCLEWIEVTQDSFELIVNSSDDEEDASDEGGKSDELNRATSMLDKLKKSCVAVFSGVVQLCSCLVSTAPQAKFSQQSSFCQSNPVSQYLGVSSNTATVIIEHHLV